MDAKPPIPSGARRPFRFGVVAAAARSAADWLSRVRRVEQLGYASLVVPDGLQHTLAPLPALAAAATASTTLHLGTYVLANDFRHPVLLAKDVATLDLLADGRVELGLGAGRPDAAAENAVLGLPFESGAARVARLAESVRILKALLSGQRPGPSAAYPGVAEADISPRPVARPPILIAGSGPSMLRLAAREADIVALGLPPNATEADAAERLSMLRDAAGDRFSDIELNINLMAVADQVPRFVSARLGLDAAALGAMGAISAAVGSTEQMCDTLLRRREQLGFSYVLVSDELMEAFAPVVARLAGQ